MIVDAARDHRVHRLRHVIEDDDVLIEPEVKVGNAAVVARSLLEREFLRFEIAHAVETGEADEAAGERRRQPKRCERLRGRGPKRRRKFAQDRERIARLERAARSAPMVGDRGREAARREFEHRPRAEDRVSPDGRAVLDRLEQEARRGALIRKHKPPIREHRRKLVAHQPTRQDHKRSLRSLRVE